MIGWVVRNFISIETKVVLKIYETLIIPYMECCSQVLVTVMRLGDFSIILGFTDIKRFCAKILLLGLCEITVKRADTKGGIKK